MAKGISNDLIKESLSTIDNDDQLDKVIIFLRKELDGIEKVDYDLKAKLTRKLISRGFSFDLIKKGFAEYKN